MAERRPPERGSAPVCRWRTSAETLDLIEALERIEALLIRLDDRLRQEGASAGRDGPGTPQRQA
jgi:hypothetical protein